jgi:SAM-dependent MidA family methyltransferase
LIEIGPGEGTLATNVLKNLPWLLRRKTLLHLVETSVPLAKNQQKLLGNHAIWHREMKDALAACGGNAVIFSNELVDAFPVRRFQKTPAGWQEIAVHFDEEKRARESLFLPGDLPDSSGFSREFPIGQRIEVHESYRNHLTDWLPFWKSGRMLTIDYGATRENLYHRQPLGSIRAYLLQHRLEGAAIYENVGRQDLTADVNFTDGVNPPLAIRT